MFRLKRSTEDYVTLASCIMLVANLMLSVICQSGIKPYWYGEIRVGITAASLLASNLVKIFRSLLMTKIERNLAGSE